MPVNYDRTGKRGDNRNARRQGDSGRWYNAIEWAVYGQYNDNESYWDHINQVSEDQVKEEEKQKGMNKTILYALGGLVALLAIFKLVGKKKKPVRRRRRSSTGSASKKSTSSRRKSKPYSQMTTRQKRLYNLAKARRARKRNTKKRK